MEWIFWASAGLVLYVYVGYPVLVWVLAGLMGTKTAPADIEPRVTVVIAAHNEAADIERTVRNKLEQDYPAEKLKVVVVSDASTDGTDVLVAGFGERVKLLRQELRAGKTAALNMAIPRLDCEIVVFADANSLYEPSAVRRLVRHFSDPRVGYVTGKMVYTNPDGNLIGDGCSAYMKYENFLRAQESCLASVIGVDGGIDAMRRALYGFPPADQQSDFILPLAVAGKGLRVVYESGAILKEPALGDQGAEYRMRVRVALRAMWALWDQRRLGSGIAKMRASCWAHRSVPGMATPTLRATSRARERSFSASCMTEVKRPHRNSLSGSCSRALRPASMVRALSFMIQESTSSRTPRERPAWAARRSASM